MPTVTSAKDIYNDFKGRYDPSEEAAPQIKAFLDWSLTYLLNYIPGQNGNFRSQYSSFCAQIQRLKTGDNLATIRDAVDVFYDTASQQACFPFLQECYAQLKEYSLKEAQYYASLTPVSSSFSVPDQNILFDSKIYTIGKAITQLPKLVPRLQQGDLFKEKINEQLFKSFSDFSSEYFEFFHYDLFIHYEMEIKTWPEPLTYNFASDSEKKYMDAASRSTTLNKYKYVLDNVKKISNKPIQYGRSGQSSTTIQSYFSNFSKYLMLREMSPFNAQDRVHLNRDNLDGFIKRTIQQPISHAVMYNVVAQGLQSSFKRDNKFQGITYDNYMKFLKDPRTRLIMPSYEQPEEFSKFMFGQVYKISILNNSFQKQDLEETIFGLIFQLKSQEAFDYNFLEQLQHSNFPILEKLIQQFIAFLSKILDEMIWQANNNKQYLVSLGLKGTKALLLAMPKTKDELIHTISVISDLYNTCKQYPFLRGFIVGVGKFFIMFLTFISIAANMIIEFAAVVDQINWEALYTKASEIVEKYCNNSSGSLNSNITLPTWNQFIKPIYDGSKEANMQAKIYSVELARELKLVSNLSKSVIQIVQFYMTFVSSVQAYDTYKASAEDFIDSEFSIGVTYKPPESSPGDYVAAFFLGGLFGILVLTLIKTVPDDQITDYLQGLMKSNPELKASGVLS